MNIYRSFSALTGHTPLRMPEQYAKLARQPQMAGRLIVTLFPDSGEHYLSMDLFG